MIVIVRERILICRRTDILDVGESILDVGEQTVGETTAIPFFARKHFKPTETCILNLFVFIKRS